MSKVINISVDPSSTKQNVELTIQDPIPFLTGNVIGFTQTDPLVKISGGTPIVPIPPVNTVINFTCPQTDPSIELYGGGRGLINFYEKQVFPYNAKDNYRRFSWIQFQTQDGLYDFSLLDSVVKTCKLNNQKLSFRIGCVNTDAIDGTVNVGGFKCGYPAFLNSLMQNETVKPWNNGKIWFPNWNSESFLSNWEKLLNAVASHIKSVYPEVIFSIDFGGYGNYWAEWHMDSIPEPTANKATPTTMIRIANAHCTAFPDYPLITNADMYDLRYCTDQFASWAISGMNDWGLFGFRSDHVGWFGPTGNDYKMQNRVVGGINIMNELQQRRWFAPMIAEPMNGTSGLTPAGGKVFDTLIDEVKHYGFSMIENEAGVTNADAKANFMKASLASGYRIGLAFGLIDGNIFQHNWINTGVAPVYENYEIWFELFNGPQILWSKKSEFNLNVVQSTSVAVDQIDRTLKGDLYVVIKDPKGYRQPLTLANTKRQTDGSYFLTKI